MAHCRELSETIPACSGLSLIRNHATQHRLRGSWIFHWAQESGKIKTVVVRQTELSMSPACQPKQAMITSDLIRAVVALGFILAIGRGDTWLLYSLSALLMGASPFFTAGRSAILPAIATREELHTANSLTQTTGWT